MSYKPSDFYISVIDLLGIIVPGAAFTFFHGEEILKILTEQEKIQNETITWIAFFFGSYLFGQILLGASVPFNRILTNHFINKVKDTVLNTFQLKKKKNKYDFYEEARKHLPEKLKDEDNKSTSFNWIYSYIRINSPSALTEIERQAAGYKFFRSLTLLCLLEFLLDLFKWETNPNRAIFFGILFIVAGWRFLFLLRWTYRIAFEYYSIIKTDVTD